MDRGPLAAVCGATAALIREHWGRGPKGSRAHWAGPDTLLVVLDDAHTEAERALLAGGHATEVLAGRRLLSRLMEPELRRIAETETDRTVAAMLAETHLEPDVTMLLFLLADRREDWIGPADPQLGAALQSAREQTAAARAVLAQAEQAKRISEERRAARQQRRRDDRDDG